MKKFNVHLYFEGSYAIDVMANNEMEALEIARAKTLEMSDSEFLDAIMPQYCGGDAYPQLTNADDYAKV